MQENPKAIDSNKELLEDSALLTVILSQPGSTAGDVPPQAALAGLAKELSLPNVASERVGNTMFVTTRGTGANKNKAVTRLINIDTKKNLIANSIKFLQKAQRKGITHLAVDLRMAKALPLAKQVVDKMNALKVPSAVYPAKFKNSEDGYRLYFMLNSSNAMSK